MMADSRLYSSSTVRNREPILDVLRPHLPQRGLVLEIASGTGEHTAHFAAASGPDLVFQPSDPEPRARASTDAWIAALGLNNVRPALALNVTAADWAIASAEVVICINMIHISPWEAAVGLMRGAASLLPAEGILYLYGPYRRGGRHTAASNEAFDRNLRARNPAWGVRDLETVAALAESHGFVPPLIYAMPANNLSLIFRRLA